MKGSYIVDRLNRTYGFHFLKVRNFYFIDYQWKIVLVITKSTIKHLNDFNLVRKYWKEEGFAYVVFDFEEFKKKNLEWIREGIALECNEGFF